MIKQFKEPENRPKAKKRFSLASNLKLQSKIFKLCLFSRILTDILRNFQPDFGVLLGNTSPTKNTGHTGRFIDSIVMIFQCE